jgi:hypothetical protein
MNETENVPLLYRYSLKVSLKFFETTGKKPLDVLELCPRVRSEEVYRKNLVTGCDGYGRIIPPCLYIKLVMSGTTVNQQKLGWVGFIEGVEPLPNDSDNTKIIIICNP